MCVCACVCVRVCVSASVHLCEVCYGVCAELSNLMRGRSGWGLPDQWLLWNVDVVLCDSFNVSCKYIYIYPSHPLSCSPCPQITPTAGSPMFSNKIRYPYLFRAVPPETEIHRAQGVFVKHFNWDRVAIVVQNEHIFSDVRCLTVCVVCMFMHCVCLLCTYVHAYVRT